MSLSQMKRALWFVNELVGAKSYGVSYEDLSSRWQRSLLNDKKDERISERTFFRLRRDLESLFDINIEEFPPKKGRYRLEMTENSVLLSMLCKLVTDNSARGVGLDVLLAQVIEGREISVQAKRQIYEMAFRLNKASFLAGQQLITDTLEGKIAGADNAQWSPDDKYRVCIYLDETYERIKTWIGVAILPQDESDCEGSVRLFVVNETQDVALHERLREALDLDEGVKEKQDYWWFAPRDESFAKMTYVTGPDVAAIRERAQRLLAGVNRVE